MRRQLTVFLLVAAVTGVTPAASPTPTPNFQARQWGLDAIEAPAAWGSSNEGNVVVAVVDSGLDPAHPEFAGRIVHPASWICDRHESVPCHGTDDWGDENGHGTHVAGIIAAADDGRGVTGVAPDARIMPVRVLDAAGEGWRADVEAGIRYATSKGAHVINLSIGGLPVSSQLAAYDIGFAGFTDAVEDALAQGIVVVVSADNDTFPMCSHKVFRDTGGLCVGATDRRGLKAAYSNFGAGLDLVAPGGSSLGYPFCEEGILSTHLVDTTTACTGYTPGYDLLSGSSMAAPFVSGVAALLRGQGIKGEAAVRRILETADDRGPLGYDPLWGDGRVNARRAVTNDRSFSWSPWGA